MCGYVLTVKEGGEGSRRASGRRGRRAGEEEKEKEKRNERKGRRVRERKGVEGRALYEMGEKGESATSFVHETSVTYHMITFPESTAMQDLSASRERGNVWHARGCRCTC